MKVKTVGELGEDAVVERLVGLLNQTGSVISGPGDDCAVVRRPRAGSHTVLKTDAVVEGVHFDSKTKPGLIGRKALARVISDFAAMGATPRHALVTVLCPSSTPIGRLESIYRGLQKLAGEFGVSVVGGELSRGRSLSLSVALEGEVGEGKWRFRCNGKAGDVLLVTGKLGGSLGGRHLTFRPRLAEGKWLARRASVHAMMDLSDGLAKDLLRLAKASGVSFQVEMDRLPRHRGCSQQAAWGDGEDYELLVAVAPRSVEPLKKAWMKRFPQLPLTTIGTLVSGDAGTVDNPGGGWDPFVKGT